MNSSKDKNPIFANTWKTVLGIVLLFITVHLVSCEAAIQTIWPG